MWWMHWLTSHRLPMERHHKAIDGERRCPWMRLEPVHTVVMFSVWCAVRQLQLKPFARFTCFVDLQTGSGCIRPTIAATAKSNRQRVLPSRCSRSWNNNHFSSAVQNSLSSDIQLSCIEVETRGLRHVAMRRTPVRWGVLRFTLRQRSKVKVTLQQWRINRLSHKNGFFLHLEKGLKVKKKIAKHGGLWALETWLQCFVDYSSSVLLHNG